ncbi:hypothetical protein OPV22_004449 [Ensete ventricosum]|uniref:Uncharacterized protein n=1 Tax=Ensete ventricosum TaxID=4639 RepID=A0AAV8S3S6_ENSVE|nr:hypothetical protein OPV22_004449 [Ensete ventricosum]
MASELFYLCFRPWQRGHATFYGDMSGHETVRNRSTTKVNTTDA